MVQLWWVVLLLVLLRLVLNINKYELERCMVQQTEIIKQLGTADFQAAVLANPHQALRKIGVEMPADTEVKVVRNSKHSLNVVIPVPDVPSTALSDNELAQLAAGEVVLAIIAISAATIAVVTAGVGGVLSHYDLI